MTLALLRSYFSGLCRKVFNYNSLSIVFFIRILIFNNVGVQIIQFVALIFIISNYPHLRGTDLWRAWSVGLNAGGVIFIFGEQRIITWVKFIIATT